MLVLPGDASSAPTGVLAPAGEALERARQVAAAWPGSAAERIWRTGYQPWMSREEWLPGDFSRNDGAFAAFLGGRMDLPAELPAAGTGTASFPDGTALTLPLTDPRTANRWLGRRSDPCTREPCDTRLTVTAVRPATRPQRTSRGTATVPVWEFVFAGLGEPYAVAAAESQEPPGPSSLEDDALPEGVTDVRYLRPDHGARWLEATLYPRDCADALPGAVYETADVLVLVGRTTGRPADCGPYGGSREARFRFARPLGDRVVLNLAGRPVSFPAG